MDEGSGARSAAIRAVQDVTPHRLRERLETRLAAAPPAPGEVAMASARHHAEDPPGAEAADIAGAVQQIFVGLRITRELIETDPWTGVDERPQAADLEIVAADVLLARGVARLAWTDVRHKAVAVVREFGQDQADRLAGEDHPDRRNLEASILDLAIVAGAASAGVEPDPAAMRGIPYGPGIEAGRMPPVMTVLEGTVLEAAAEVGPRIRGHEDGLRSGAGDTD
ncbi:MAG: hypothetical protein ACLFMX_01740 [Halobacteriales archaeon]